MKEYANGPLVIAPKIVALASEWTDGVGKELGHGTYTSWLRSVFGFDEAFFRDRARALKTLGRVALKVYDDRAAVYVAGIQDDDRRAELLKACVSEWNSRRGAVGFVSGDATYPPLTKPKVACIRRRLWDEQPEKKRAESWKQERAELLAEIARLRARLTEHGIDVE